MHTTPSHRSYPHLFTVDVEEHFQVTAFEHVVERREWETMPSRVRRNTEMLLELLADAGARATFFILGWVGARHAALVREILACGHEVASHGCSHERVMQTSPRQFREDVRCSKAILEDIGGVVVRGYRAPSFSIVPGVEWAFDILMEEGYRYDSSIFPIRRRGYGYPDATPTPHLIARRDGVLCEFPLNTLNIGGFRLPAAGGAYFRHFPYEITRRAFAAASAQQTPGVFYIHPWELDTLQPRLPVRPLARIRHYGGLGRTAGRLRRLLSEFSFISIADYLDGGLGQPTESRHLSRVDSMPRVAAY